MALWISWGSKGPSTWQRWTKDVFVSGLLTQRFQDSKKKSPSGFDVHFVRRLLLHRVFFLVTISFCRKTCTRDGFTACCKCWHFHDPEMYTTKDTHLRQAWLYLSWPRGLEDFRKSGTLSGSLWADTSWSYRSDCDSKHNGYEMDLILTIAAQCILTSINDVICYMSVYIL